MATVSGRASDGKSHHLDRPAYAPLQTYALRRLAELQRDQQDLSAHFRDHPIGRLTEAALQQTLEECRWLGLSREAERILQGSRRTASA